MSRLCTFFKDAGTEFGVFYPKRYLLAVFPKLAAGDRAKEELNHAGRLDEDVIREVNEAGLFPEHILRLGASVSEISPERELFPKF